MARTPRQNFPYAFRQDAKGTRGASPKCEADWRDTATLVCIFVRSRDITGDTKSQTYLERNLEGSILHERGRLVLAWAAGNTNRIGTNRMVHPSLRYEYSRWDLPY